MFPAWFPHQPLFMTIKGAEISRTRQFCCHSGYGGSRGRTRVGEPRVALEDAGLVPSRYPSSCRDSENTFSTAQTAIATLLAAWWCVAAGLLVFIRAD